jgi:hypothetical protein
MEFSFTQKRIYARSNRHHNECYCTVMDKKAGSEAIAYLEVNGKRENLIYKKDNDSPAITLARNTYILSPMLAGPMLFWVEQEENKWKLKSSKIKSDNTFEQIQIIPSSAGRPMSLSCFLDGDTIWLTWEERINRKTKIRLAKINGEELDEIIDITDSKNNSYDPAVAVDKDGKVHVIYCAFIEGNYRIMLQKTDKKGVPCGTERRVSNKSNACVYPSIYPRKDGGVWYSYTHYGAVINELFTQFGQLDYTFVQHFRRKAQNDFYNSYGIVNVGVFTEDRLWSVPKSFSDGMRGGFTVKDTAVPYTLNSHHSVVMEDAEGRAILLYRQHDYDQTPEFENDDEPLTNSELNRNKDPWRNYPALSMTVLNNDFWSKPIPLIKRAHFDMPITYNTEGRHLNIAFTEDNRSTGPGNVGEWFDDKGQVGCGFIEFELKATEVVDYKLYPFVLTPCHGPSMEEPQVDKSAQEYQIAFGQTHIHSFVSNCGRFTNKCPNMNYRFIQDVQHADFAGITDHVFNMWHMEMLFNRKLAEYYYFPGHFVAIPAYEWTGTGSLKREDGPYGHIDVLYLEEDGDLEFYTPFDQDCKGGSLKKIWETFKGRKIITIPHHMADVWHPFQWEIMDTEMAPVVEVFQTTRGSYEKPGAPGVNNFDSFEGKFCADWLQKGKKFGFIGGGEHSGTALAGLIVKDLTRKSLYEAFMAKRTFATTGLIATANFTCNESPMGSSVKCDNTQFKIKVKAAEPIYELQIVKNGEEYKQVSINGLDLDYTWRIKPDTEEEFWYCRVIFKNNEIVWTSPIWIKRSK